MNVTRVLSGFAFVLLVQPGLAHAACNIDGPSGNTSPVSVSDTVKPFGGTLCGHTVYGPNCTINVDRDGSTNADCLTLGPGVTLNGAVKHCTGNSAIACSNNTDCSGAGSCGTTAIPAVITCGDSSCNSAINVSDTTISSGQVVVNSIDISGCFEKGMTNSLSVTTKYNDGYIDLSGSSCQGDYGTYRVDVLNGVSIRNADVADAFMRGGGNITDAVFTASPIGVKASGSAYDNGADVSISNGSFYGLDYSLVNGCCNGPSFDNISGTSFSGAGVCHYSAEQADSSLPCFSLSSSYFSGQASFVDYELK